MNVSGIWYNELNSTMELKVHNGVISGWYVSAVGKASGPYALIGYVDTDDSTPTLGWVVRWQNDHKNSASVTSWCAQAQVIDGEEHIDATWLLTRSTSVKDDWEATMIGKDIFSRIQATPEQVALARQRRGIK